MENKCAFCDVEITKNNKDFYGELLPAEGQEPAIMGYVCKECNMDECIFCDKKCEMFNGYHVCKDCRRQMNKS